MAPRYTGWQVGTRQNTCSGEYLKYFIKILFFVFLTNYNRLHSMRLPRGRIWNFCKNLTARKSGQLGKSNSSLSSAWAKLLMLPFLLSGILLFYYICIFILILVFRRLELLARSGRFADSAAVLQETSSYSPEEATIISEVLKDLKQHEPEKVEEFAVSILPWLEMVQLYLFIIIYMAVEITKNSQMTYRGFADDIWMQLVPMVPQFCINMITKFQEQLEEQFDRKTVQESDRKLMVSIPTHNKLLI